MKKIKVKWEVADGYAGSSRPQSTTIDIEATVMGEDEWNALPEDKRKEIIEDIVRDDFDQKITFEIYDYGL